MHIIIYFKIMLSGMKFISFRVGGISVDNTSSKGRCVPNYSDPLSPQQSLYDIILYPRNTI